jgi:NifU-like protein involved in Fe-S cluster formation
MSEQTWEETLRAVVRKYRDAGGRSAPRWLDRNEHRTVRANNSRCGDRVTVHLAPSGELPPVWVDVAGCAVCHASAAVVEELGAHASLKELTELASDVISDLEGGPTADPALSKFAARIDPGSSALEDVRAFLALRRMPERRRCAALPWEALTSLTDQSR